MSEKRSTYAIRHIISSTEQARREGIEEQIRQQNDTFRANELVCLYRLAHAVRDIIMQKPAGEDAAMMEEAQDAIDYIEGQAIAGQADVKQATAEETR